MFNPSHRRLVAGMLIVGLGGALLGGARASAATTFFVRTSGNDTNDGLTPQTALGSIRQAGSLLLDPGDRVVVGPGDYHEGNIEPRRGGDDGAPVAFVADTTGTLTDDPPGPVRVLPDGSTEQTTGFIVFGKRHIRIEGFTIAGASDAGIQVRPSAQLGGTCADITIIGNAVSSSRDGIEIQASGPVVITGNTASDTVNAGILLTGESGLSTDATLTGNHLMRNRRGIDALSVQHAVVANNDFTDEGGSAMLLGGGDDFVFQGNTVHTCAVGLNLVNGPANVTATGNLMQGCQFSVLGDIGGPATISGNTMSGTLRLREYSLASTPITVEENQLSNGYFVQASGTSVVLHNNTLTQFTRGLQAYGSIAAEVIGNEVNGGEWGLAVNAPQVTVQTNQLHTPGRMTVRGDSITFDANSIDGATQPVILNDASTGAITNNHIEGPKTGLWYKTSTSRSGSIRFSANSIQSGTRGILVGGGGATPATDVEITGNHLAGAAKTAIWVMTTGSVQVTQNDLTQSGGDGISLQLDRNASTAVVTGNTITGGSSGIFVDGVRSATLQGNTITAPGGFGCLVRNGNSVDIESNQVHGSGNDAINVAGDAIQLGDCDRDGTVTADEIARAEHRLFDDTADADCSALGPNQHGDVSVAALVAAVQNAAVQKPQQVPSGQVDIRNNLLDLSGGVGILAYAAERVTIAGNTIRNSTRTGVSATGTPAALMTLQANSIDTSGSDCVLVSGGNTAELTGAIISTCGGSGMRMRDTTALSLEHNQVSHTTETGIFGTLIGTWQSSGNRVSDAAGGIAVLTADSAVIENEQVARSAGTGLLVANVDRVAASQCQVTDSTLDSIAVRQSQSVQLVANTLTNAGMSGITIGTGTASGADDIVVDSNQISGFHKAGVDAYPSGAYAAQALVLSNDIRALPSSTGAGVSVRYPVNANGLLDVAGNHIRAGIGDGIYLENAPGVFVWDNAVFSSNQNGVFVNGADTVEVINTLAYANGQDGIRLAQPGSVRVENNTLYENGFWGLMSSGATHLLLINNILDRNVSGSVMVDPADRPAIDERFNLTTGAYSGLTPGESDVLEDPRFVDPAGPDGILGGDGAADDDFHLSSGNNGPASPAIDAGSDTADFLGISGTAIEGGQRDTGPVDLGYHYDASPRVP